MKARRLTECALMVALLTAVQYTLGFIVGIELVTVVFAAFCTVFGAKSGVLTGIAFSLLRCLIFGFYPSATVLYLVYYTLFSLVFGALGSHTPRPAAVIAGLFIMSAASAAACAKGLRVSVVYQTRIRVMLFVLSAITALLAIFYISVAAKRDGDEKKKEWRCLANATSLAVMMTVGFTLLDDVITPLMMGYTREAAIAYFYGGFLAMIPQTICAAVSVFILFMPLKKVFEIIKKSSW